MVAHWYWFVGCKTPGCPALQPIRYIGNDIEWPDGPRGVAASLPSPFSARCGTCGSVHNYELKDLRTLKVPTAPSHEFENLI